MQPAFHAIVPPERYFKALVILGFLLLFCAIADLALGIANAVVCGLFGSIGYGIWGSIICLAAGISGIVAGFSGRRSTVVVCMVLSILAAVSAAVQLGMGAGSAVVDHATLKDSGIGGYVPYPYVSWNSSSVLRYFSTFGCSETQRSMYPTTASGPTVTDALLASFAIIQGVVAIVSSAYSCRATVCYPGLTVMPWQLFGSRVTLVSTSKA